MIPAFSTRDLTSELGEAARRCSSRVSSADDSDPHVHFYFSKLIASHRSNPA